MNFDHLREHDLIILKNGRRGVVDDTFWRDKADEGDKQYGKIDVVWLDENDHEHNELLTAADIAQRFQADGPRGLPADFDWIRACKCACHWTSIVEGEANWNEILTKPWKWLGEAWLGGMDVPGTLEEVTA